MLLLWYASPHTAWSTFLMLANHYVYQCSPQFQLIEEKWGRFAFSSIKLSLALKEGGETVSTFTQNHLSVGSGATGLQSQLLRRLKQRGSRLPRNIKWLQRQTAKKKNILKGWENSSVVKCLLSLWKALGSILKAKKIENSCFPYTRKYIGISFNCTNMLFSKLPMKPTK